MNSKSRRLIKILVLLLMSFSIIITVLFFTFVAPYRTIPILMYHSISDIEEKTNILSLDREIFKRQMEHLLKHNYKVVPLKTVAQIMRQDKNIPRNWVIITFDDGYRDFYSQAYPVIKDHQFNVTVFLTVDYLESNNKDRLTWQLLSQLQEDGLVDIGSHSLSHRPLILLSSLEAKQEILISKLMLEGKIKKPITVFSYPYGAVNDLIKELVKESGYKAAVGIAYQRGEFKNQDIYILRRVFVSKLSKYPFVFRFMLSGYYVPTRELILRLLNIKAPRDVWGRKK